MPKLSLKKIFIVVFALVLLAYSHYFIYAFHVMWEWFVPGLEPLQKIPHELRLILTVSVVAIIVALLYRSKNRGNGEQP